MTLPPLNNEQWQLVGVLHQAAADGRWVCLRTTAIRHNFWVLPKRVMDELDGPGYAIHPSLVGQDSAGRHYEVTLRSITHLDDRPLSELNWLEEAAELAEAIERLQTVDQLWEI